MRRAHRSRPDNRVKVVTKHGQHAELLSEYDFSSMNGGVRGKYYERYRAGVNLALLEPEVAKAYPTDSAVSEALRTVLRATKAQRRPTSEQRMRARSAKGKRR